MAFAPIATGPVRWHEEAVEGGVGLANRLAEVVWLPASWPFPNVEPDYLLMTGPSRERGYQVRSRDREAKRLFAIFGKRRRMGAALENGLNVLPGEPVETLAKSAAGHTHVVVRMPEFDVHLAGNVSLPLALTAARTLQAVLPSGGGPLVGEHNQ